MDNNEASRDRPSHSPHRTKKRLGQHFLRDRSVPPRIAEAAGLQPSDLVIEVGPGLGILTEELADRLDPARGSIRMRTFGFSARAADGTVSIPDGPGIGIEISGEDLAPFAADHWQLEAQA